MDNQLVQILGTLQSMEIYSKDWTISQLKDSYFTKLKIVNLQTINQVAETLSLIPTSCNFNLELDFESKCQDLDNVVSLSQSLARLVNISHLKINIDRNKFGDKGIEAISQSLSKLVNLKSLYLNSDNNLITDSGFQTLAQSLSNLVNLTTLELGLFGNKMNYDAAVSLATSLSNLTNLTSLFLSLGDNSITDNGALALCQGVSKLSSLNSSCLLFECMGISEETQNTIEQTYPNIKVKF
jgi:hypothetical protein